MRKVRYFAEAAAIALVFAFVVGIAFPIFYDIAEDYPKEGLNIFLGAFLGAFFSYLFVRVGIALDAIRERHSKHRNALVRAQHRLNDALNIIGDDLFVVDKFEEIFNGYDNSSEPRVFGNVFHLIPYDQEVPLEVANVEYTNQLVSLYIEFRKLNDTMTTIDRNMRQTTNAFIQGHIDHRTYVANINHTAPNYGEVKNFLLSATDDAIHAFAVARTLAKSEHLLSRLVRWTMPTSISAAQRQAIATEEQLLRDEIERNAIAHREKIQRVSAGDKEI